MPKNGKKKAFSNYLEWKENFEVEVHPALPNMIPQTEPIMLSKPPPFSPQPQSLLNHHHPSPLHWISKESPAKLPPVDVHSNLHKRVILIKTKSLHDEAWFHHDTHTPASYLDSTSYPLIQFTWSPSESFSFSLLQRSELWTEAQNM